MEATLEPHLRRQAGLHASPQRKVRQHGREAGEQALPRKLQKEAAQLERAQAGQERQVRPDLRSRGGNSDMQVNALVPGS